MSQYYLYSKSPSYNIIFDSKSGKQKYKIRNPYFYFDYRSKTIQPIMSWLQRNEYVVNDNFSVFDINDKKKKRKYKIDKPRLLKTNFNNIYIFIPYCELIHICKLD